MWSRRLTLKCSSYRNVRRGDTPSGWRSVPCVSYHAVHGEVVVLGLQLHGVGVVVANLRVACQEQALVVQDPVKHLKHRGMTGQPLSANTHTQTHTHIKNPKLQGSLSTLREESVAGGRPECVSAAVWARDSCHGSRTEQRGTDRLGSRVSSQAPQENNLWTYGVLATSSETAALPPSALLQPLFNSIHLFLERVSTCQFPPLSVVLNT